MQKHSQNTGYQRKVIPAGIFMLISQISFPQEFNEFQGGKKTQPTIGAITALNQKFLNIKNQKLTI